MQRRGVGGWLAAVAMLLVAGGTGMGWARYAPRHARRDRRRPPGPNARPPGDPGARASPATHLGATPDAAAPTPVPTEEAPQMSATRPDMGMTPPSSLPLFPLAFRGYDRELVDARLAGLATQLEKERQRGDQAERALRQFKLDVKEGRAQVPAWFANVGAEVDRVVDEAGTAAAKLLAQAGMRIQEAIDAAEVQGAERLRAVEEQARQLQQAAHETLAEAQTTRARIEAEAARAGEETRAKADLEAKALLARANDEARVAWEHATRERQQIEAESDRLNTLRQAMVDQLAQVYAPLGLTLVDTRLDPGVEDGHLAEAGTPVPAAVTDAGQVGGEPSARPEARSERGGGAS